MTKLDKILAKTEECERMIDRDVLLCCWTIRQVNAESYERASFCVHCGAPIRAERKGTHTQVGWGGNYNIHGGGCASSRGGEGVSCLLVA